VRIAQLDAWERERQRYELKEFPAGTLAYSLKADDQAGEPRHHICPACYQEGRKSILQATARHSGGEIVVCPRCETKLKLENFNAPTLDYSGL